MPAQRGASPKCFLLLPLKKAGTAPRRRRKTTLGFTYHRGRYTIVAEPILHSGPVRVASVAPGQHEPDPAPVRQCPDLLTRAGNRHPRTVYQRGWPPPLRMVLGLPLPEHPGPDLAEERVPPGHGTRPTRPGLRKRSHPAPRFAMEEDCHAGGACGRIHQRVVLHHADAASVRVPVAAVGDV